MNRSIPGRNSLVIVAALVMSGLVAPLAAQRQQVQRQPADQEPAIKSLAITVEDMGTGAEIGSILPGETVEIEEGQQVRLRMAAIPVGANHPTRYPSTRFTPNQTDHIKVDKINPEVGAIIVTGRRSNDRGGAVPIQYEVLESWRMNDRLRTGRVYVKVIDRAPAPPPLREEQSREPPRGVTFFSDDDFRGRSQMFTVSDDRLDDNPIGNDRISSLRVDPGCRVELFEDDYYRGRSSVFEGDVRTLRGSEVGNDSVSSFRIDCSRPRSRRGLTLYADSDYRGDAEDFYDGTNDPDLRDNRIIRNDRASSVRIDPGCEAWLFTDRNFEGRSFYVTADVADLGRTTLGNDSVSSVRVSCRDRR